MLTGVIMKERICCFTGHRKIPAEDYEAVVSCMVSAIRVMREMGVNTFCAGGELGFDTEAAICVLLHKKLAPPAKLLLVLPCKTQAQDRTPLQIKNYEAVKEMCDEVLYISEEYTPECMSERNRALVDMSSHCICYLRDGESGNTADTVAYAKKKGLEIINVSEYVEAERK